MDVSQVTVGRTLLNKAAPTRLLCSLKGENVYQFEGDRTREEIVAFAQRLMGPAVRAISSADELMRTVSKREIAFAFIGEPEGRLWVRRNNAASCVMWSCHYKLSRIHALW